jgi:uncharacterized protein YjbI with pentapeptide repeats
MAEGDATVFNHFKEILLHGEVDLVDDTLKVILLDTLYSFSADGSLGLADVDSREITATGYTAGGCTLAGGAVTQRDTVDNANFDGTDLTWANLGSDNIIAAVLYDDTVTATGVGSVADPLLIYWEIATNSNGGNYTLQWGASGLLVLS